MLLLLTAGFYWKLTISREWTWLEGPDLANVVRPWLDFQAREFHAGRLPAVGSLRVGGPHPDRPGAARHYQSAELDSLRHAAARRAHSRHHAALVLGADSLAGGGVLLCAVPRSGGRVHGVAARRLRLRAGRIRGPHRLAADSDERDLGAAGASVLRARGARLPAREQRGAVRRGAGDGVPQRTPRGAHVHRGAGGRACGWCMLRSWRTCRGGLSYVRLGHAAIFGAVWLLVSAVQVLPAIEYAKQSLRWAGAPEPLRWGQPVPYDVHAHYSLRLALGGGDRAAGDFAARQSARGLRRRGAGAGGALVPAAGRAACAGSRRWRLGGLLLALGKDFPPYWLIYRFVPMVEKAREPAMAIVLFQMGIAVLAALGPGRLRRVGRRWLALALFLARGGLRCAAPGALRPAGIVCRDDRGAGRYRGVPQSAARDGSAWTSTITTCRTTSAISTASSSLAAWARRCRCGLTACWATRRRRACSASATAWRASRRTRRRRKSSVRAAG